MSQQTPTQRVLFARRFIPALLVLFGVFSLLLLNFRSSHLVQAATSNTINFQARLETSSGAIAADGNYNVEFKLYNAASAGTAEWTEDYTYNSGSGGTDARVRVANGYLSVSLGSITPFPNTIDWTQPQWITMNIGGTVSSGTITWDGEMSPRLQLTAVPYAFASGQLQTTSGSNTSTLSIQAPTGGSQTFQLQNQGAAGTYNLLTQNASTGIATLGTASTLTGSLAFANAGSANTITLTTAAETVGNATITIPNTAGANDTVCLLTLANCGGSLSLGTYSTTNTDAHGATLSAGVLTFQNASATAPGMVGTGTQTFAGNKTFSGSTTLNNTTLAAGTSITITGGNTASRPASPTEGMLYYDTTTHSLLAYSNGKWQADRSTATKIVASGGFSGCTGTSPVVSSNPDAADFVTNSCTSAQNAINNAIAALPAGGGTVYLMEGTYIIDGPINLPSNVTLTGAGPATIIKLKDGINANISAITNASTSGGTYITVSNLALNGNKANNTSGTQYGFGITTITSSNTWTISNVVVSNFRTNGYYSNVGITSLNITGSTFTSNGGAGVDIKNGNVVFTNNTVTSNMGDGVYFDSGVGDVVANNNYIANNGATGIDTFIPNKLTVTGNNIVSNSTDGIFLYGVQNGASVTGNNFVSNGTNGIEVQQTDNMNITGNVLKSNASLGIRVRGTNNSIVSGNILNSNGGTGSNDSIAFITYSTSNVRLLNNSITTTAIGYGINLGVGSGFYLSNNVYSGPGTAIHDTLTDTVYANQSNGNGSLLNTGISALTVGTSTVNGTLSLQGGITAAALGAPSAPTLATAGTAGSTSYTYAVTALDGTGETLASTATTIATGNATLNGTNYIKVTFSPVSGATSYKVYRTASGGSPATTGYIGTVTSTGATTYTFNDTGLAASGSVPAGNTTGGGTFAGTLQGASGTLTSGTLTLGTASTSTGGIKFYSASGSGSVTLTLTNPGTTNYTLSIPALTGNDTICTVGAANCTGGSGSGVTGIGTYNSQTASANGAVISGTTLFLQSASGSTPGLIDGTSQSFSGNKTFSGILTASATGGNVVAVTGAPTNSATSSLIQIGNAIAGGNSATNGGTYLGMNLPASGAGSAADLINFQANGSSLLQLTSAGKLTLGNAAAALQVGSSGSCAVTTSITNGNNQANINAINGCYGLYINNPNNGGVYINGAEIDTGGNYLSGGGTITTSATGKTALTVSGAPAASATSSLIQIGNTIAGGNSSANGGTYIGLNAPSSGAGSAADFLNFEQAGTSNFQVTSNGFIWSVGGLTTNGNITIQGASTLSVGGTINTISGYQFNGTSGATTTCSSGQFLQNQVVKGGISTGGTCAAAGGGVTTVGTFSGTSIANGASITGSTITFGPADGTNPGMVTTGPQSFAGAKTFTGGATVATTSTTAFQIQTTGGSSTLLTANTSSMRISIGSIGTSTGQLYVAGAIPSGAVGSGATGSAPQYITVQGRYAYVVNNTSNTLQVFDVSNPASPVSVGSVATGTAPYSVTVQGHYAYVTSTVSRTLQVFDVSNPASPVSVGSISTGGSTYGLAVQGRYAYVGTGIYVSVFDVSNPASPAPGPSIINGNYTYSIAVQGRYAYAISNNNSTLAVIDISNPNSLNTVGSVATGNAPYSVTVQGRYAYVTSSGSGLQIFDISNPASPVSVGSVLAGNNSYSVTVQGRYAYVVDNTSNTLQVFDISNPASPVHISNIVTGNGAYSVTVQGRYAYVVNASSNTLQIFDIGGTYTQSLEAGSIETSSLAVNQSLSVNQSASIQGGLTVGQSLQVASDIGIGGKLTLDSSSGNTVSIANGSVTASYTITLPTAAPTSNGQCLQSTTVGVTSWGTCGGGGSGHAKKIILTPEYAGAVLDGSSDAGCTATNGTMTSGFDTGLTGFGNTTQSYYKWQNGVTGNQCYDIVVQVPVPSDFSSWASTTPITINTYTTDTTNGLINLDARDTSGTAESGCSYVSATPASTNTWTTLGSSCTLAGTYAAGSYMTLRVRVTAPNGGSVKVGNIVLNYNSSY